MQHQHLGEECVQEIVYLSAPKLSEFGNLDRFGWFWNGIQEIGVSTSGLTVKFGQGSVPAPILENHLVKIRKIETYWQKKKCTPYPFYRWNISCGEWISFTARMSYTIMTSVDDQFLVFLDVEPVVHPDGIPYRTRLLLHASGRNLVRNSLTGGADTSSAQYSMSGIFYPMAEKLLIDENREFERFPLTVITSSALLGRLGASEVSGIIWSDIIHKFVKFLDEESSLMIESPEWVSGYARVTRTALCIPDQCRIVVATPLIVRRANQKIIDKTAPLR